MIQEEMVIELISNCTCSECGAIRGYDEQDELVKKKAKEIIDLLKLEE